MGKRTKDVRNIMLSDFYCTKCGMKGIPVFRTIGQEREPGHLKKLFCLNCQEETNQAEIRPRGKYTLDDFWIEYQGGNFDKEGNRITPWKNFIMKARNEECKESMC